MTMKPDRPSGVQTASTLKISELGDATCDDVQCYIDSVMSSGIRSGFELTNSRVASELDVELGTGFIKITDSCVALTKSFDFAGVDNVTLTDNKTNYIYVDYNGGTPQILATTSRATIERYRQFTLGLVSKEGSTLRIEKGGVRTCDIARILHELFIERDGFSHISGAITTETGALNLYVTIGVWYRGLNRFTTPVFNTSVADTFEYTHYGAASWITDNATATVIDATHYNDGTDVLGSLTVNAYGTQWVYVTAADDLFVIYGTENGTLSDAHDASPPTSLPEYISTMGELIAKIIVRQTGVIISIEAVYDVKFSPSGVFIHNEAGGLNEGDYQHLTAAQLAALVLNKWDATVAPTVNEDSGDGYGVGSVWVDVTADKVYTCLDATLTAAVWVQTNGLIDFVDDTSPQLGGILDSNSKQVRFSKGSDVASANALTLGNDGNYFDITGTTAITSIVTKAIGTVVKLHFDGILTLTHHATDLILPSGANITTAAGDEFEFTEYASGDWRCTGYVLASGYTVLNMAPPVDHTGSGTIGYVTVDVNAYGIGAALYIAADGHYEEADADAAATMPCVAIALEAGTGTKKVLFWGIMRNDTWTLTPGGAVYVSTTAGTLSTTAPTGTGKQVQKVGTAITADVVLFNPSPELIELA